MDDGDVLGAVRVGVHLIGRAVRRPARVPNSDAAHERAADERGAQVVQLADGLYHADGGAIHDGDARAVVAAVLEARQAVNEPVLHLRLTQNSNNPTHLNLTL